jgi:hypothetical protein
MWCSMRDYHKEYSLDAPFTLDNYMDLSWLIGTLFISVP